MDEVFDQRNYPNNYTGNVPNINNKSMRPDLLNNLYGVVQNIQSLLRNKVKDIPDKLTNKNVTIQYKNVKIVLSEDSVSLYNPDGEILSLKKVQEKWKSSALKNNKKIGFRKEKFIQGFYFVFKHAEDCNVTVLEDSAKE